MAVSLTGLPFGAAVTNGAGKASAASVMNTTAALNVKHVIVGEVPRRIPDVQNLLSHECEMHAEMSTKTRRLLKSVFHPLTEQARP